MTPDRWRLVDTLYHSARECEPSERAALLAQADPEIRREVESLLEEDVARITMLDQPAWKLRAQFTTAAVAPGLQLGQYRIEAPLGEGGMGEVYRATDTKLGREVAIKVLPREFVNDPDRLARFRREAQLLASLNHPNIATLHGLEESGGSCCLVMELVPGETLAERLGAGAIPVEEVLRICIQIADALGAAHRKGITHRDIKPANIKVTPEGRVKVLDFGLAKAAHESQTEEPSHAQTLTELTQPGLILGTPSYMSPEQARGEPVDRRVDVWAFGCVLFELLVGQRPFRGGSVAEIIACVLKSEPDWQAVPSRTPAKVRDLLRHCLQKDRDRRLSDITDARKDIEEALRVPATGRQPAPDRAVDSLAVLPFANTSGDPQMEYLSDGLTESIIFSLSQLPQLRVMSRSAVFRFKGRSQEAQEIGQSLGVGAVLTGKVLQRGETLLISAELVDVENGWQRWGAQYRRKVEDIFAMEEEIAKEISENLRLKLTPEKENLLARRYTDNVEAYHLYLKGRFYWAKRTEEGLLKGIQYFRQAIELDPTYALAYAGVAEGYVPMAVYCHLAPKDACPKAMAAARAALEIDSKLSEALTVVGATMSYYDWDLENAEKELRQAVALDPKYPRARQALAENLTMSGRFEEAVIEAKRALELDPLALSLNAHMAMTYYFAREYDKAIEHGSRTVDMDPNFFPGYFYLGMAYQMNGQFAEAAAALQQARVLSNNSTLMVASLGGAVAAWGKQEEARNILQELEQMGRRKYVSQVFVAAILTGLGEIDQALTCLETAYQDRCTWLPRCLAADGRLDRLHSESRLQRLMRRVSTSYREGEPT
jgi:serine/threonine protein kinase/tetratricopeptide (TPR) repeat protein